MMTLLDMYIYLFPKRLRRILEWMNYDIGFSGNGPTFLDKRPASKRPNVTRLERKLIEYDGIYRIECELRQEIWRNACIEILGEDPEEWEI